MYLYNLSNSPVLISEGPPSIYLDYPCRAAASFSLLLLPLGCVRVRAPAGVPCARTCRAMPLSQGTSLMETTELPKGEKGVHPLWLGTCFPECLGRGAGPLPLPSARRCQRRLKWGHRRCQPGCRTEPPAPPEPPSNPLTLNLKRAGTLGGQGTLCVRDAPCESLCPSSGRMHPSIDEKELPGGTGVKTPRAFLEWKSVI